MYNKTIIRANGIGFYILIFLCLIFIIPSFALIVCFFIPKTEMYHNWLNLMICFAALCFFSYQIFIIIRNGKVVFDDTMFITYGQNKNIFPEIKQNCSSFINYRNTSKLGAQCIEFTLKNNKKILFHTMQFSKKQIYQILKEIQIRGGLKDIDIKIK